MPVLSEPFREARRARNLTQPELAMMSGVCLDTIKRIEKGSKNVRIDDILRLCGVLRVRLGDVVAHPDRGESPWLQRDVVG
jgi:HTH-type transcriptional regulator / antitoxin HipB